MVFGIIFVFGENCGKLWEIIENLILPLTFRAVILYIMVVGKCLILREMICVRYSGAYPWSPFFITSIEYILSISASS